MKIGVLALQGGVIEHIHHIKALGHEGIEVKNVNGLKDIQGIILPGGESTTMGKLLKETNILQPLKEKILSGFPVWGTCAGMILLAKDIEGLNDKHLQVMDIKVKRNAYGSQIDSFKASEIIHEVSCDPIPLVFIRAPFITDTFNNIEILHKIHGNVVAARQNNMLATSFHPELTDNLEFHKYFLNICSHT